jgi:hypothetical protein
MRVQLFVFRALQAKPRMKQVRRCVKTVQLEDSNPTYKPQRLSAVNVGKDVGKINLDNQNVNGAQQDATVV